LRVVIFEVASTVCGMRQGMFLAEVCWGWFDVDCVHFNCLDCFGLYSVRRKKFAAQKNSPKSHKRRFAASRMNNAQLTF
jgi:hypothetical protein